MSPAEQNYNIYEKELMAIVKTLRHWRIYLQGSLFPVIVHTDHMNLRSFTTTKVLDNRRLARWAEELSSFNIVIKYVKGKENARADALSRKPGYENDKIYENVALLRELPNGDMVPSIRELAVAEPEEDWTDKLKKAQQEDVSKNKQVQEKPGEDGLYRNISGRIWLPDSIKEEVISQEHGLPAHGHQGIRRTHARIARNYWCEKMHQTVKNVVSNCDTCIRNKSKRQKPYGQMITVPIPQTPWESISWDFIGPLPSSKDPTTKVSYDSILIIMERLTKYMILLPFNTTYTAEDLAEVFLKEVVSKHGLPREIISDRDKLFTSKFWTSLTAKLGAKRKLSTSFHPQTNGGNERMNQVVEAYLRCYINYQQNNWVQLLPLAEFAYNSSTSETIKVTPFFANYGYELEAYREPINSYEDNQNARVKIENIKDLHTRLSEDLAFIAERNAYYYNKTRSQEPTFKEGDRVYLLRKNITTKRPSDKLDHKKLGPFKIKTVRGPLNYELDLPATMNIHPTFHVSLLEVAPPGAPPAPVTEIEPVNPEAEYEVEELLDSKWVGHTVKYLVKWVGYPQSENTWEPKENLTKAISLLASYHREHGLPRGGPTYRPHSNRGRGQKGRKGR
jgi:hypothetical protein